jgi:hypothetical protein
MVDKPDIDDLINELIDIPLDPILAPRVGEEYHFTNALFRMEFDFEIIKEYHDYYDILINGEKPDILKKDFDLVEMMNDGLITKKLQGDLNGM